MAAPRLSPSHAWLPDIDRPAIRHRACPHANPAATSAAGVKSYATNCKPQSTNRHANRSVAQCEARGCRTCIARLHVRKAPSSFRQVATQATDLLSGGRDDRLKAATPTHPPVSTRRCRAVAGESDTGDDDDGNPRDLQGGAPLQHG
eukprot:scaffold31183_cov31-Tisochrysis_lutea.AAC.5